MTTQHDYLSTGCLHGEHDYCNSPKGRAGEKKPSECKFCDAMCRCECHRADFHPDALASLGVTAPTIEVALAYRVDALADRIENLEHWIIAKGYDLSEVEEEIG